MKRRGATAAERRKWPNGVKKYGFAALPDDVQTSPFARPLPRPATLRPPTSAGGQENSPPGDRHPFFKISLGAGATHEAANRTPLPGRRHSLFKISLGAG